MTLGEYAASLGHFARLWLKMGLVVVVGTFLGRNLDPFSPRILVISNQIALSVPKKVHSEGQENTRPSLPQIL